MKLFWIYTIVREQTFLRKKSNPSQLNTSREASNFLFKSVRHLPLKFSIKKNIYYSLIVLNIKNVVNTVVKDYLLFFSNIMCWVCSFYICIPVYSSRNVWVALWWIDQSFGKASRSSLWKNYCQNVQRSSRYKPEVNINITLNVTT